MQFNVDFDACAKRNRFSVPVLHKIEATPRKPFLKSPGSPFKKYLLVMKLTVFLTLLFTLSASAKISSQTITYKVKSASLEKVFERIESQTGYVVFYDYGTIKSAQPVTIDAIKMPLNRFLETVLTPAHLHYSIVDKTIIISRENKVNTAMFVNAAPPVVEAPPTFVIQGVVTDVQGVTVEGVAIVDAARKKSTMTDALGKFSLAGVQAGDAILISRVGYKGQTVHVNDAHDLKIVLQAEDNKLDSIIVVGYGTQKKVDLTGAVATLSGKDLANRPVPNLLSAMQGMLPGVAIMRGSGQPGSEGYGIRIRGFSSTPGNQPDVFVLIDGMEGDITLVNPDDVESMSVLKDAAAAAIYGSRAAGGVILVTTKKGVSGATKLQVNAYYGIDITARQPQRLNSWDEQILINEARFNATGVAEFTPEQIQWLKNPNFNVRPNIAGQARWDYYDNVNWIQEGMNKYNPSKNYTFSLTQGTSKLNYLLSGGYYSRRGVLKYGPDDDKRYNLRLNINSQLNQYMDLSLRASYAGSFVASNSYGATNIAQTLYRVRTRQPVFVPSMDTTGQIYNGDLQVNPIDIEKNAGETDNNYEVINGQANLRIHDLVKGLTINLVANKALSFYNSTSFGRSLYWYGTNLSTVRSSINTPNFLNKTKNREYDNNVNAYATYQLDVRKHNFSIMGGYQFEEDRLDQSAAGATGMITNDFYSFNYADATTKTNKDSIQTWALGSVFGRFNYNFDDKYLFEANIRYDGSSKLSPSRRWQSFPSLSAGWNIHKEKFMEHVNFISTLKLRGSWGKLGNGSSVSGNYGYLALLSSGTNLVFNDQKAQYISQTELASTNKTWEIIKTTDIGLDMGFMQNRLNVTADYYWKKNNNMLAKVDLPNIVGVGASQQNIGELKTWGWEFNAQWRDHFRNGSYSISFNISNDQNKLVRYSGTNAIGTGGSVPLLEGYAINTIWGYKTDGYYASRDEYVNSGIQSFNNANVSGGDVKYLDLNGDKIISAGGGTPTDKGDLTYLGTTNGHYLYGLNLSANWKRFDFSTFIQGVAQRKFLIDASTLNPLNATQNMPWTIMMDRWTPDNPNPNALFPREYQANNFNFNPSDKWVQNGAYVRLKNVQIGYTIPFNSNAIKSIRIYFSGQDLWEKTKVLSVFDPEVSDGVSAYSYPFFRVVSFGANIKF